MRSLNRATEKKIPWQLCLISDIRNDLNHVSKIKGVAKL